MVAKTVMFIVISLALLILGSAMANAGMLTVSCNDNSCTIKWGDIAPAKAPKSQDVIKLDPIMTEADWKANISEDPAKHGAIIQ